MATYPVYQLCHEELCFRDCKHKDADQLAHQHILVRTIFILTFSYDVAFDFILYFPSTIFQFNRDGSSWVEPVLS